MNRLNYLTLRLSMAWRMKWALRCSWRLAWAKTDYLAQGYQWRKRSAS